VGLSTKTRDGLQRLMVGMHEGGSGEWDCRSVVGRVWTRGRGSGSVGGGLVGCGSSFRSGSVDRGGGLAGCGFGVEFGSVGAVKGWQQHF
jgi:hypothetical protein